MLETLALVVCIIAIGWGWHQRQTILRQVENDARAAVR